MILPDEPIYYGHKHTFPTKGVQYWDTSPDKWWVELFGGSDPIVPLRVRERVDGPHEGEGDPESPYWGWLATDDPNKYIFIFASKQQLDMCFPYGPDAETARGRGRCVNLMVEEIEEPV